jgi:hypothetical protein
MLVAPFVGLLLAASAPAADAGVMACCKNERACPSRSAAAAKLRCTLTGTEATSCCCVQRDGKLFCTLAKKHVESCCCEPASRESGQARGSST